MASTDDASTIGANLRLYRIRAGLTRAEVCRRLRAESAIALPERTLHTAERGERAVSAVHLRGLAAALRVDLQAFYEDPCPGIVLDRPTFRLVETYRTLKRSSARKTVLQTARALAVQERARGARKGAGQGSPRPPATPTTPGHES